VRRHSPFSHPCHYGSFGARIDVFNPRVFTLERVSIGGSRAYPDLDAIEQEILTHPLGTIILTGSTHGVDVAVRASALRHGLTLRVYRPRFSLHATKAQAYFARNRNIVDDATRLVSFWDGTSVGTKQAIDYARERGMPVSIRLPRSASPVLSAM
jgi:hypothetical protein